MLQIRIDDDLNKFAHKFSSDLFKSKRADFKRPEVLLNNLIDRYKTVDKIQVLILKLIKNKIEVLKTLKPKEQAVLINKIQTKNLNHLFFKNGKATSFSNDIVNALRYDELRESYAYKITDKLGLKVCPYCNAMLAITVNKQKNIKKARFQLDHYFPKSRYPFLSISFFNLIPCCGNCNQSKSNSDVDLLKNFHLYTEEEPREKFKFKLEKTALVKNLIHKSNDIKFAFTSTGKEFDAKLASHKRNFDIEGLYNTQKDVIQELIWKSQAYNSSRIKELAGILNIPEKSVKRMVLGNYIDKEDIHKRPLAKFMQDIAKDLGLL